MAYPNLVLVDVLRQTASNLKEGAHYAWGTNDACNCGNLFQVVANMSKEGILTYAHKGFGECTELAEEYLDGKSVLEKLPGRLKWLKRNKREDVVLYFSTFAEILEESYRNNIRFPYPPKEVLEPE